MTATIRIPTPLRTATAGAATIEVKATTLAEAMASLTEAYPAVAERLFDEERALRRFINIFVDDEDIRFAQGLQTPVHDGSTISIIPAVAGG